MFAISRFQHFKISTCSIFQDFNISRFPRFQNVHILHNFEDFLKSWNPESLETLKYWILEIVNPWRLEMLKFSRCLEILKPWTIRFVWEAWGSVLFIYFVFTLCSGREWLDWRRSFILTNRCNENRIYSDGRTSQYIYRRYIS